MPHIWILIVNHCRKGGGGVSQCFSAELISALFKREGVQFLSIIDLRKGGSVEYAFGRDEDGD
jgi:hypothetical protein